MTMPAAASRYDAVTIVFHWLTAVLVVVLAGTAFGWKYLPREWHFKQYESLHVSLGIALAAVLIARLLWRFFAGRRLAHHGSPVVSALSRLVHWGLYLLLAAQVGLGFALRWLQGETFSFFGLFAIPEVVTPSRALAGQVEQLHSLAAWGIVILAFGHAAAALVHRYVFKDRVLSRMLPVG
jgi:cytochrome b561